ncbi:MAG: hypothetical protein JO273_04650 [Methylobacteriaceae bacterium]|nr:hypothetical protein [Methylobacteriaceae bacterium]
MTVIPRLDILSEPQRRLWSELRAVPPEFVLYLDRLPNIAKVEKVWRGDDVP